MRDFQLPRRSTVYASGGMASTSHSLASQTAISVLRDGGNAIDAALAAVAVQCVVEPGSTGIGGDCFCLYAPEGSSDIIAFNGSGAAPLGLSASTLTNQGLDHIPLHSPHAVTIPGAVDAWAQLNTDYSKKPLAELLQPAIDYATNGYPITPRVAYDFAAAESTLRRDPDTMAVFMPNDTLPAVGSRQQQPILAKSLQHIAEYGRDGFYTGWIADDIISKLQQLGGTHSQADFSQAKGEYVTPISSSFHDHTVWQCPPNGQGVIALLLLNMVSNMQQFGDQPINLARIHHEIEAGRLAYRDRGLYLADPQHSDIPTDAMLNPEHAQNLMQQINPNRAFGILPPCPLPSHKSTVYISVIDKDRNACSLINTVFHGFGSGIMAAKSGVLLQNRGAGFIVQPNHPNCVAGGKKPLHTIIPAMVSKDNRVQMSFGVMGGDYQAFGHMQFLSRLMDFGQDIQAAQDTPRFFPDPYSRHVEVEHTIPESIRTALTNMGHDIVIATKPIGGSQAIAIDWENNILRGGSDPRKDGCAIGY